MKSNICKIENGTKDLAAILSESANLADSSDLRGDRRNAS